MIVLDCKGGWKDQPRTKRNKPRSAWQCFAGPSPSERLPPPGSGPGLPHGLPGVCPVWPPGGACLQRAERAARWNSRQPHGRRLVCSVEQTFTQGGSCLIGTGPSGRTAEGFQKGQGTSDDPVSGRAVLWGLASGSRASQRPPGWQSSACHLHCFLLPD